MGNLVRNLRALFTAALLAGCLTGAAWAQGGGEVTGTVTDSSGAIIPHANVRLTATETGQTRTATSNGAGIFEFPGLDVGHYDMQISAPGFSMYKKNGIVMNVAQTLNESARLTVGGSNESVTVQANALQVQSETSEISSLITGKQIEQLATNGRNVISLTTLGTGVANTQPAFNGVTAQGSNFDLSFNGMRPDHNNWLIDGGEVYDRGSGGKLDVLPSPDILSEFQVLSSNYTPDYGISSGGTVTMVIKSGTKDFHGGLWEFNRNDDFDAGYYFSKQNNQASPELRLNIFGGDIGGPVVIPGLFNENKQKLFFFASEEWRRFISGVNPSVTDTIPTNDFPTSGQPLAYTPFNSQAAPIVPTTQDPAKLAQYAADGLTAGQPFPNNTIPANLLDPNALLFLSTGALPKPNSGTDQYVASPKQPTYVREDVARVDYNISEKLHLLGSWIHDASSQTIIPTQWSGDSYDTVGNVFSNPSWAAVIKLSQTISPTLLNETALNVNGNTIDSVPTGIFAQPAGWSAGSFFTGNNAENRLPQIAFSGGPINTTYTTSYWPWRNSFLDYQLRDDLTWVLGKHSLKFGFSYMRTDKNQQLQADTQGDYSFSGSSFSKDAYVNFLLGFASSYDQLQAERTDHWLNNTYSFYGNDDWHLSPRLTLNLGVRYDALPHVYEKNNQVANFNPAAYSAADAQSPDPSTGNLNPAGPGFAQPAGAPAPFYLNGIQLAGVNGVPRGLVQNSYFTVQPRLGFAYDINGDGKTVIRGGAGIFYERVQGNDTYNIDTTPPFSYQPSANNVYFSNPNTSNQSGATATLPVGPAGLTNLSSYYPNPGTAQYSFGVQQQLAPSVVASLGYVGTSTWSQDDLRELNDLPLSDTPAILAEREAVATGATVGVSGPNANLYRPFLGYSNIRQEENGVNASYHSLQASLRMENRHGLSLQFSYTWSHEIDIASADITTQDAAGSGGTLSDPYDPRYDRGSGLFDRRNIFNANYIYQLPFYLHGGNFVQHEVLGGWEVSGITVAQSGTPVNIYYNGPDTLGLGGNTTNRPNIIANVTLPKTQLQWFSTSSFANPAAPWTSAGAGTTGYGDARKDNIVGPGLFNWNLSLYKDFELTSHEGPHLQFRAESYNTFNHTEFNGIDTGTNDSTYGQVTSTYDPRVLQFGLKLLF